MATSTTDGAIIQFMFMERQNRLTILLPPHRVAMSPHPVLMLLYSKWFEPRSISSSYSVIVRVSAVLKRTAVGDRRPDNLSGSHPQSQVNSVCQSMMLEVWSVERDWSV